MTRELQLCAECNRHVRVGDCACPFCGSHSRCAAKTASSEELRRARAIAMRVGLAAGTAATIAACTAHAHYGAPFAVGVDEDGGGGSTVPTGPLPDAPVPELPDAGGDVRDAADEEADANDVTSDAPDEAPDAPDDAPEND